jgi:hypothetical protein
MINFVKTLLRFLSCLIPKAINSLTIFSIASIIGFKACRPVKFIGVDRAPSNFAESLGAFLTKLTFELKSS